MFLPDRISEERMAAYREGVEKGRSAVRLAVLCRLVFSAKIPSGEALEMIGVPKREWEHYRRELKSIEKQRSNEKLLFWRAINTVPEKPAGRMSRGRSLPKKNSMDLATSTPGILPRF